MEVEKISKTCIIPSSPTPSHLKTYKISLLDQVMPPTYTPMILYYLHQEPTIPSADFISNRSQLLKQSLSDTLSRFYPLAGKVKDNLSIDCNDEGVSYEEARASISLSEYLNQPDLSLTKYLLPGDLAAFVQTPGSYIAMIQETTFTCGGFAIGVLVSHVISDGTTLTFFLKSWAASTCKGSKEILHPYLDGPSIFPQNDGFFGEEASIMALCGPFVKKMKVDTKRFLIDASAIESLKNEAISAGVENPTRVEVVTSLLSKRLMAAFEAKSGVKKPLAITLTTNLRRRAEPPLEECSMGNFIWVATALYKSKEEELSSLVLELRKAIEKINGEFVKRFQGDGGYEKLRETMKETSDALGDPRGVEFVSFTSWCNFGYYEIDFGWGKPAWSSCVGLRNLETLFMNSIVLMDAKKGKGVEAWAFLDEQDTLVLEKDEELLQYATVV